MVKCTFFLNNQKNLKLDNNSFVCGSHFESSDYKTATHLKNNVFPRVFGTDLYVLIFYNLIY